MENAVEKNETGKFWVETRQFWMFLKFLVVFMLGAGFPKIFEEKVGFNENIVGLLFYAVALPLVYWIPPRNPVSYPRWLLFSFYLIFFIACFFLAVNMVERLLWKPAIGALIIFAFFLSLPLMIGRIFPFGKQQPFRKCLQSGLIAALVYGTLTYLLYFLIYFNNIFQ